MQNKKVIHCDMKPENILFTDSNYDRVKIIDFGASCEDFTQGFFYVQSRYYRAPEIVLGIQYDHAVDMWSFGCILYELIMGHPLFPAKDENELLEFFIITVGEIPSYMLTGAKKYKQFFSGHPEESP
jgi:serine/threonine protein kinase